MAKKISVEESDQLFAFTIKHFVEYYDLQNEFTDHLANGIEERWITDPNLSFDDALKQEFKKFGVFGFMGVVEQRQKALTKKYNRLIWGYFKQFLKLPKIIVTLLMILLVYRLVSLSVIAYSILFVGILVFSLGKLITMNIQYKKKVKQTRKKWLLEELIMKCGGFAGLIYIPYNLVLRVYTNEPTIYMIWIMSVILIGFGLYQYVILFIIPRKAEEHLTKTYPEYNL